MEDDLEEFLEEYDETADFVVRSDHQYFILRLKQWLSHLDDADTDIAARIHWLEQQMTWQEIETDCMHASKRMVGSDAFLLPEDQTKRLSAYINTFRRMANGDLNYLEFSHNYFHTNSNNISEIVHSMIEQLFEPFVTELRRYIKKTYDHVIPEDARPKRQDIPASDRIVPIDHNSEAYTNTLATLEKLQSELEKTNLAEPDERERGIAELSAGQRLLKAKTGRISAIFSVLGLALVWIVKKFADTAIGAIAQKALAVLQELFPSLSGMF